MALEPLAEIPINAYVAWCPVKAYGTLLALGGRHMGAACLDFALLNMGSLCSIQPTVPLSIKLGDTTLGCLSWSSCLADRPLGILATGFHDGAINLWDPSHLVTPSVLTSHCETKQFNEETSPGRLAILQPEVGDPLTCMEFNALRPSLLACGHSSGALQIINVESMSQPEMYDPGAEPDKAHGKSSVTCVSWNQSVQHIMASTCANGSTAIWNLKQRKASIIFRDPAGRARVSSLAWLPNQATQVVVAYDNDSQPSLQVWDLRNTSYPFKEFQGHSCGITHVEFSPHDPSLMLSCGKDNRLRTWSMREGGLSEAPTVFSEICTSQWQISARWSPCLPGLVAASSHTGGVLVDGVERHQNVNSKHIARWNHKPCGGNFGFAGNFVHYSDSCGAQMLVEVIPSADAGVVAKADRFEEALRRNDDLGYCQAKSQEAMEPYERLVWKALGSLLCQPEARSLAVLDCFDFDIQSILKKIECFFKNKPRPLMQVLENATEAEGEHDKGSKTDQSGGEVWTQQRVDASLEKYEECGALTGSADEPPVDAESFFNGLGHTSEGPLATENGLDRTCQSSDDYKKNNEKEGEEPLGEKMREKSLDGLDDKRRPCIEPDLPLEARGDLMYGRKKSSCDRTAEESGKDDGEWRTGREALIRDCFFVAERHLAIELCIEAKRWPEALLLAAASGDPLLWSATAQLYFVQQKKNKFLQLVGCILSCKWDHLVDMTDLERWSETVVLLASYAPPDIFSAMCEAMAGRLERERLDLRAAAVCYLLAGNSTKVGHLWSRFMTSSSPHHSDETSLQDFVEKMTILMRACRSQQYDALYSEKASLYAELLANSGRLTAGMKFLCLISHQEESPSSLANILRDRIYFSCPEAMVQAGMSAPAIRPFSTLRVRTPLLPSSSATLETKLRSGYPATHAPQPSEFRPKSPYPVTPGYPAAHPEALWRNRPNAFTTQESSATLEPYPPLPSRAVDPYGRTPLDVNQANRPASYSGAAMDDLRKAVCCPPHLSAPPNFPNNPLHNMNGPPNTHAPAYPGPFLQGPSRAVLDTPSSRPPPYSSAAPSKNNPMIYPHVTPAVTPGAPQFNDPRAAPAAYSPLNAVPRPLHSTGDPLNNPPPTHMNVSNRYASAQPLPPFQSSTGVVREPQMSYTTPTHSTAPAAGVTGIPQGMPVPWPIPTGTQQVASVTSSTAPANQKIHVSVNPPVVQEPMPKEELELVENIIFETLQMKKQNDIQNAQRFDDLRLKISEMIAQLQRGSIARSHQHMITKFCYALRARDMATATQMQTQLTRLAWTRETRVW